jgi:hypothetical protein
MGINADDDDDCISTWGTTWMVFMNFRWNPHLGRASPPSTSCSMTQFSECFSPHLFENFREGPSCCCHSFVDNLLSVKSESRFMSWHLYVIDQIERVTCFLWVAENGDKVSQLLLSWRCVVTYLTRTVQGAREVCRWWCRTSQDSSVGSTATLQICW